jgi:hypothetical protein
MSCSANSCSQKKLETFPWLYRFPPKKIAQEINGTANIDYYVEISKKVSLPLSVLAFKRERYHQQVGVISRGIPSSLPLDTFHNFN